jgi:hypothetical protein
MWTESVVDKCHVLSERLSGVIDKNPRKVYIIAGFIGEVCARGLVNMIWEYQPLDRNLCVILCGS